MKMAELEKAELTSIRLEAGKIPDKEEEVEQKLAVTEDGSILFETSCFGEGFGRFHTGRQIRKKIGAAAGRELLRKLLMFCRANGSDSMNSEPEQDSETETAAIGTGFWTLQVQDQNRITCESSGILEETGESCHLSDELRRYLQIERCWLFGEQEEAAGDRDGAVTLDDFPKG